MTNTTKKDTTEAVKSEDKTAEVGAQLSAAAPASEEPKARESRVERLARELQESIIADKERRVKQAATKRDELVKAKGSAAKAQARVARLEAEIDELENGGINDGQSYAIALVNGVTDNTLDVENTEDKE